MVKKCETIEQIPRITRIWIKCGNDATVEKVKQQQQQNKQQQQQQQSKASERIGMLLLRGVGITGFCLEGRSPVLITDISGLVFKRAARIFSSIEFAERLPMSPSPPVFLSFLLLL